jgi:hypothetical protein
VFKAEKTLSKIKILELAKPLFSLWCKGKEAAESYFTILDQLANKDARLLTAITRADLPYHHHTETEVEEMIKQFVAFLDSIYFTKTTGGFMSLCPGTRNNLVYAADVGFVELSQTQPSDLQNKHGKTNVLTFTSFAVSAVSARFLCVQFRGWKQNVP